MKDFIAHERLLAKTCSTMTRYRLNWTNHKGERKTLTSYSHENAVQLLNILILDNGFSDAKLTTIRASRVREIVINSDKL